LPPTEIVLLLDDPPVNVPPDTVRSLVVAIVVDEPATVTVPPEMRIEATVTFASTVTVPVLMVTESEDPGTPLGLQFEPRLQLPEVTFQDLAVASAVPFPARTPATMRIAADPLRMYLVFKTSRCSSRTIPDHSMDRRQSLPA
jgi:hypothetical protein